jgi:Holliday junction resolvasome RuvABC endonuclease subunit
VNIIGIDPSLAATGMITADGVTTTMHGALGDERLVHLWHAVQLAGDGADLAVIEDLPTHGMGAGKTGMAQGVVRLALMDLLVPYVAVTPASLKKFATGRGNATKADMRMELWKRANLDLRDDNQVDAWWLRQMGLWHYHLGEVALPATHLGALGKVDWNPAPAAVAA